MLTSPKAGANQELLTERRTHIIIIVVFLLLNVACNNKSDSDTLATKKSTTGKSGSESTDGSLCAPEAHKRSLEAMNAGVAQAQQRNMENALHKLREATELCASNHHAWYSMGQIHTQTKRWDKAVTALTQAVAFSVQHDEATADGARNDENSGPARVTEVVQTTIHVDFNGPPLPSLSSDPSLFGDPMNFMQLGVAQWHAGDIAASRTSLQEAVKREPRLARAHEYLGLIHAKEGHPEAAELSWKQSIKLNPSKANPYIRLSEQYTAAGKHEWAISLLEQGRLYARSHPSEMLRVLAASYAGIDQRDKAITFLEEAMHMDQYNHLAQLALARLYVENDDQNSARRSYQQIIESTNVASDILQTAQDEIVSISSE